MTTKFLLYATACALLSTPTLAAGLPTPVTGKASAGLVKLATTGNPEGLHEELGGKIDSSDVVAATVGEATVTWPDGHVERVAAPWRNAKIRVSRHATPAARRGTLQ